MHFVAFACLPFLFEPSDSACLAVYVIKAKKKFSRLPVKGICLSFNHRAYVVSCVDLSLILGTMHPHLSIH